MGLCSLLHIKRFLDSNIPWNSAKLHLKLKSHWIEAQWLAMFFSTFSLPERKLTAKLTEQLLTTCTKCNHSHFKLLELEVWYCPTLINDNECHVFVGFFPFFKFRILMLLPFIMDGKHCFGCKQIIKVS